MALESRLTAVEGESFHTRPYKMRANERSRKTDVDTR